MNFFRSVLGSNTAKSDIPYNVGEAYTSAWGTWTHRQGTAKDTGDPVSIFILTGNNAQDAHLIAARNGAKRLRTLRHPNVLSFLHSTEVEKEDGGVMKPTIYLITEPVMPLADKIKELQLEGVQRNEYYAWGLHQIAKAVSFLSNDCKLVHGNICVDSVVVTPTLDWKLHFFDVLSEFDGGNASAEGPMLPCEWLVGAQYKPLEVAKGDWSAVRKGPPYAIDSWGLGCLIQELFSGSKLTRTEELRNTTPIPKNLLPDYQRLLNSQPPRRMNPSRLIDNSEFFQNKLVDTIQFMEVLNLKDSVEKDNFFRKLLSLADQLPRQIVLRKLLPQLASALEFGAAPAPALNPLLKLGSWLPPDDFNAKILPTVVKLFASTDRGIRVGLLQNIESFGSSLSASVVDEQIFNHVATGFSDTSAFLRELTLKSMLIFAPKLSQRNLTGSLLKYLSKLQVDEEPAIRTNTTILLGNMARHLNDSTRKRVLINAFTARALRDTFPPARSAGIMALMATKEYYDVTEVGTRILPNLVLLTVDTDMDVREKAFQGSEVFLQTVKEFYAQARPIDSVSSSTSLPPTSSSSSGLLGWAVSSLTSKSSVTPSPSNPTPPLTTTVSAPASTLISASTAVSPPRPLSQNHAEPPSSATPASDNGWTDVEESPLTAKDEEGGEDKDGWGDLDDDPTSPPPPPPVLSRIQAAQKRPVVGPTKPSIPRAVSNPVLPSQLLPQQIAPQQMTAQQMTAQQVTAVPGSRESSHNEGWANEEAEDPWAAIAAPKPTSVGRPTPGTNVRTAAGARTGGALRGGVGGSGGGGVGGGGGGGGHVQLRGSVSLEDMLGSSMEGGSGSGSGRGRGTASRGRGRTTAPKLGAQRVAK